MLSGRGKLTFARGDPLERNFYIGWFSNGECHGFGTLYFKNGDCCVSKWNENEQQGLGIYIYANGMRAHVHFKSNRYAQLQAMADSETWYENVDRLDEISARNVMRKISKFIYN